MVSFDALRASHIGEVSYLCKSIIKPVELLGCWPCNYSMGDVSRYSRPAITCSNSIILSTDYVLPTVKSSNGGTFTVSPLLDVSIPWTVDFFGAGLINTEVTIGSIFIGMRLWAGNYGNNSTFCVANSSTMLYASENAIEITGTPEHWAFSYDGTTFRVYRNGNRFRYYATNPFGTATSITVNVNRNSVAAIGNVRCVQKCLASGSSFEVPSKPYTGFEQI